MPGFDSPNFKKTIPQPQNPKPMREFTVGAPEEGEVRQYNFGPQSAQNQPPPQPNYPAQPQHTMTLEEAEEAARQARIAKFANANKIGDEAKKRIELLADIGRLTRDVSIGGFTFTLRTLKARESKSAALATFSTSLTNLEASYEVRRQQLARSLIKIDGEPLEVILGSRDLDDVMRFIEDNLEDIVVEKLWSEFSILKNEAQIKYGINTAKEQEEVANDLKK